MFSYQAQLLLWTLVNGVNLIVIVFCAMMMVCCVCAVGEYHRNRLYSRWPWVVSYNNAPKRNSIALNTVNLMTWHVCSVECLIRSDAANVPKYWREWIYINIIDNQQSTWIYWIPSQRANWSLLWLWFAIAVLYAVVRQTHCCQKRLLILSHHNVIRKT